jgi:hypothetical protein
MAFELADVRWEHVDTLISRHGYSEELAAAVAYAALAQCWPRWSPIGAALTLWRPRSPERAS